MGVNLFSGKFKYCVDADKIILNDTIVPFKNVCDSLSHLNYSWDTAKINFDNVLNGYLALFQVVSFCVDVCADVKHSCVLV
jgi:hypothetical protein